jgi:uncharacterized BrkB/YihY/UPF0761 family membrane protein
LEQHPSCPSIGEEQELVRKSCRALVATIALRLCLQLLPLYTTFFLSSYIGQLGFVLILLVYFYLFTLILLLGAEGVYAPESDLITQAS